MSNSPITTLIVVAIIMFCVLGGISVLAHIYNLNNIKAKTVGDGQHGTARWARKEEIKKTYKHIPFTPTLWRKGKNLPKADDQGIVVGCDSKKTGTTAMIDTGDVHALMIGAAGVGKTAYFLYPNLEYACASGMSFITSDTKGDLYRNYGKIAKECYGYNVAVIDLRNPTRSDGNNLLHLVNKYMDLWKSEPDNLAYKAKAEKYAKIISKTIILSGMDGASFGQNAFFYDAAEGLLTASILLVSEFCPPETRHIVSVFKIIQDLLAPSGLKGKTQFQILVSKLPEEHKARWFAGAALNTSEQAMSSVMSTALSRLNAFLDSELEQILCFDTAIDAEQFCKSKSAIFIVLPEEDTSKHFMVSLIVQQMYREILAVADEYRGKLPNRVMMYLDEFGTIPKIEGAEMMFSASRSRRVSIVAIIQSFAQLQKNYGKEGCEIITDNTQLTIFGGFAPNSESAQVLSKALGTKTVQSGSVSRSKNDPSQSLQMIERSLLTPDELKSLPKGTFCVMKTGFYPMQVRLKLFFKWGIVFSRDPYIVPDKGNRKVSYANKSNLEDNIIMLYAVSSVGDKLSDEEIAKKANHRAGAIRSLRGKRLPLPQDSDKDDKGDSMPMTERNFPKDANTDIIFDEKGVILDERFRDDLS
jgi:type IV secretion system protein VirD4